MELTSPLSLIKEDHDKVKKMIADYKSMSYEDKTDQADKIAMELAIHMSMEEEYFYPALEQSGADAENEVNDALSDHDEIRTHIAGIYRAEDEELLDGHMEMMEQDILEHVREEERDIFPMAEEHLKDDFAKLRAKMQAYKIKEVAKELVGRIRENY